MFRFIKTCFFNGLLFLSKLVSTTSLRCISMNNQACKARSRVVNVNSNNPIFYLLVLKQVNAVAIVIILMIYIQKVVFLMLWKT